MADKVIAASLQLDSKQAETSVKSFKSQLKDASNELVNVSDKFGATSKEATIAAKRVAELKDKIGDAKALADTFNPDKKFVAFGGAIQGVVGGFSALQGAMGLFGSESKEVEKMLLKVQSAMALQQGISAIAGAVDSFKMLGNTIITKVVTAFSTLKGAIMATGIGALVVLVGTIIANFDKLKNASGIVGTAFKAIGAAVSWVTDKISALTDWLGITGNSEDELAAKTERAQQRIKDAKEAAYDNELRLAKAVGKGVAELEKQKRDEMLKTLETSLLVFEGMQKSGVLGFEWVDEAVNNIRIKIKELQTDQKIADVEAGKKAATAAAERKAENDKKKEELAQLNADLIKMGNEAFAQGMADQAAWAEQLKAGEDAAEAERQAAEEKKTQQQSEAWQRRAAEIKQINETELQDAKILAQQKLQLAADTANALGALSDVLGKQTVAGKALAVAQALINTYQGISRGVAMGMPWGIPSIIAAAATGFKAVKDILKTKIPGQGDGGGTAPSISSVATAPLAPQPKVQTTTLDQTALNNTGNATVRAFVVESDIANNAERVRRLSRAARLGG